MMKRTLILTLMAFALLGCKEKEWVDWQAMNQEWLRQNATKDSIVTTPTGLQYKVIRQGIAGSVKPDINKTVVVDYTGSLITGNVFDSGSEYAMAMSSVVKGFAEGLSKMNKSGHYILYIPAELAYGREGHGNEGDDRYIPPFSTLIFDVTLLDTYY